MSAQVKNKKKLEASLQAAEAARGTKGKQKAARKMSLHAGGRAPREKVERILVNWVNDLPSDEVSARVMTYMLKNKTCYHLRPDWG